MPVNPPRTMLGRLRASAHLTVWVLLMFAMKIGLAGACVKHDFTDAGWAVDTFQPTASAFADTDNGDPEDPLDHAGVCTHCGCQHATAVPMSAPALTVSLAHARFGDAPGPGYSAPVPLELRPPIS